MKRLEYRLFLNLLINGDHLGLILIHGLSLNVLETQEF